MSFGEQLIAWRRELHQNPELSGQKWRPQRACASG